jgi:hypothetical protein
MNFAVDCWCRSRSRTLPPVRLTAAGPALVRLKRSAQIPWRRSLQQAAPNGDRPRISSDACHALRSRIPQANSREVPSGGWVSRRSDSEEDRSWGTQSVGGCALLSPKAVSTVQLRLLRTRPGPRSSWTNRLLTSTGDVEARFRSSGQPERTHNVMKL